MQTPLWTLLIHSFIPPPFDFGLSTNLNQVSYRRKRKMAARQFGLLVIGGGSGGLGCARRAAEFGTKAAVVEMGRMGG